ncbi:MAG: hypothetical protein WDM70_11060 [Nitrosomonadales bacterium]
MAIDINKDADIGQTGETHPGYYRYAGEYYFICQTPPIVDADILQKRIRIHDYIAISSSTG